MNSNGVSNSYDHHAVVARAEKENDPTPLGRLSSFRQPGRVPSKFGT